MNATIRDQAGKKGLRYCIDFHIIVKCPHPYKDFFLLLFRLLLVIYMNGPTIIIN